MCFLRCLEGRESYRLPVNIFHFLLPPRFFLKGQAWIGSKGFSYSGTFRNIYSRITVSPTLEREERFIFPPTPSCQMPHLSHLVCSPTCHVVSFLFAIPFSLLLECGMFWNVQFATGSSEHLSKPSLEHKRKLKKRHDKTTALPVCSPG